MHLLTGLYGVHAQTVRTKPHHAFSVKKLERDDSCESVYLRIRLAAKPVLPVSMHNNTRIRTAIERRE